MTDTANPVSSGPLKGLRIIEMSGLGPCPFAGQLMADLGADVIVIDRASAPADPSDINRRNKRSVALNLKSADGITAALALIDGADALIEGFRPGVMEKLGLGPEVCRARNPRLIYGRMTGWGQSGPLAQTAGHDINYLAITGVLNAIGTADRPPVPPLNFIGDYAGGSMFLVMGLLAALYERERSGPGKGQGQVIDAAMTDAIPLMAGLMQQFMTAGRWNEQRQANLLDGGAPFYRCYETADGKAVAVGALEPQFFAELVARAGMDEGDRKTQGDPRTWADKHQAYTALFKTKTRDEWAEIFDGSDACVAPVLSWSEAHDHPHNQARGVFIDNAGVMQTAPAPRFDRTPAPRPAVPTAPGADSDALLAEAGLSAEAIAALRESGALT